MTTPAAATTKLTEDDIEKLFSGAPQFFARSEAFFAGAPHPSVAFPFDEELEIRDLADHVHIEDKAWSGITAWPHLARDLEHDAAARRQAAERHRPHFFIRARERPNMLSMNGLEKGTMGYQAALELAVADSLEEEQYGFESPGQKARPVVEARERIVSGQGSLRRLPESDILDRLRRNSSLYRKNDLRERPLAESHNDLFHSFMRPSSFVIDKADHYSLVNQINVLVKCLAVANVWIDFSRVESRIRLGQILWAEPDYGALHGAGLRDDVAHAKQQQEERFWLLMQILVSTELLIRLDAVTEGEEYGLEAYRASDVSYFERGANQSVKWSLFLARSWLENVQVVREELLDLPPGGQKMHKGSWLASVASKMSLHTSSLHDERPPSPPYHYIIKGKNAQRQVDGLAHFARKLRWPGLGRHNCQVSEDIQHDTQPQPELHPSSSSSSDGGGARPPPHAGQAFGTWHITPADDGKKTDRIQAPRRRLAAILQHSGWLTKSYIFGLVLPGESLSCLLMSTLLENDDLAMAKLGSFAILCGGFVYANMSFWSTSCIVGRVLAAAKGSAECQGWVSSTVVPKGFEDGWLNVDVEDSPGDVAQLGKKARLWAKRRVERDSYILGDGNEDSSLPTDFRIPHECTYSEPPPAISVELQTLEFCYPMSSCHASPLSPTIARFPSNFLGSGNSHANSNSNKESEVPAHPAKVHFVVSRDQGANEVVAFALRYDISFVTAHPCSPSQKVKMLKSPTSPTVHQIDVSGSRDWGSNSRSAGRVGHPLHKFFNYTMIHITELLERRHESAEELLAGPGSSSEDGVKKATKPRTESVHVLVVDCVTNVVDAEDNGSMPELERFDSAASSPIMERMRSFPAAAKMHFESRKRQFGSDMEVLARALCAEKGWNAVISRKRRGCLACAIREAGGLSWKVILRVD